MGALLDRQLLQDMGVAISESELQAVSETYEGMLSDRVIERIVGNLTPSQLGELHRYRAKSDDDLRKWLLVNVPEIREIIEVEVEILLEEMIDHSENL